MPRQTIDIDVFKTAHIDGPAVELGTVCRALLSSESAWLAERHDPACPAEIVLSGHAAPTVDRHRVDWSKDAEGAARDAEVQGTPPPAYRTVAFADVIDLCFDLKANRAAMTGTLIQGHAAKLSL
jgi:hypothetical protein